MTKTSSWNISLSLSPSASFLSFAFNVSDHRSNIGYFPALVFFVLAKKARTFFVPSPGPTLTPLSMLLFCLVFITFEDALVCLQLHLLHPTRDISITKNKERTQLEGKQERERERASRKQNA